MKIIFKILAALFIILWIAILSCYIYIRLNGRQLIVEALSEVFHKPVHLEGIHFLFPFGLRVNDLRVGEENDCLQIRDAQIQVGLPDVFHRRFHLLFMNLSDPVLNVTRRQDSKIILGPVEVKQNPDQKDQNPSANTPRTAPKKGKPINWVIDYLVVDKGLVKFRDFSREKEFDLTLQDIGLKARNVAIPVQPLNTKFDVTASVFKSDLPFSGSRIESHGWANFSRQDLQAKVDVLDSDGKVALNSQVNSKNNDMAIDGKVHISSLIAQANSPPEASASSLKDFIFSSIQSSGVEIVADFHSQTKMDDFHLDKISFSGNLGYNPLASKNPGETASKPEVEKNIGERFEEIGKKIYKDNVQAPADPRNENQEVPAADTKSQ